MMASEKKKREIEIKIQAIEQRFDRKLQATKETIEIGKSPQKIISKRPIISICITFGLGFLSGRISGNAAARKKIIFDKQEHVRSNDATQPFQKHNNTALISGAFKHGLKKRLTQKLIDSLLTYVEESLNDYIRKGDKKIDTES